MTWKAATCRHSRGGWVSPRNAVKHWLRQGAIHLDLLLLVSWCIGLSPTELFGPEDPLGNVCLGRWQRSGASERGARWSRRDWDAVGRRFDEIVRATPHVRLRDVAARLRVDTVLLRERLPDRVATLSSRRRPKVLQNQRKLQRKNGLNAGVAAFTTSWAKLYVHHKMRNPLISCEKSQFRMVEPRGVEPLTS